MELKLNLNKVVLLCFVWAFLLLLGLAVGLNWPFVLAIVATVLYLFA